MEAMITDYTRVHVQRRRLVVNLLMLHERDAPERRGVPDNFGSGQDEHVYGRIISSVVLPKVPFAGALFGGVTTNRDENREPILQAWLYAIHWRAETLLRYCVNTMKTGAKT